MSYQHDQYEEEECEYCGGEGVVVADAPVYPDEPHMAPIAEVPCICQSGDDDIY